MIEIHNFTSQIIDQGLLKKIVREVLKKEGKEKEGLSIVLVGQARIRKLNKKYLGKNRVTDILSFPQKPPTCKHVGGGGGFITAQKELPGLGEAVICLGEVRKNAKKFNSTFEKELTFCLIHGVLHLLGYEHEKSKSAAKEMERKQKEYLADLLAL